MRTRVRERWWVEERNFVQSKEKNENQVAADQANLLSLLDEKKEDREEDREDEEKNMDNDNDRKFGEKIDKVVAWSSKPESVSLRRKER